MTDDVPVRDAATVVLLRDASDGSGLHVWLLTRVTQMAFAAGMSVFPGGRVDGGDLELPLAGGDPDSLAARFDCTPELARALIGAAVRETFEETGVLLTAPPAELSRHQADVESGRLAFGELLREHGLAVDGDAVQPWSRWITPAGEVRRYDTRFFVGALPADAVAHDVSTESSAASWLPIELAIEQAHRGERMLLPPTLVTLASLQGFATMADVLAGAAERNLEPIEPVLEVAGNGSPWVRLPDGTTVAIPRSLVP